MNNVITSSACMPKRNIKGFCATFRCFDQTGIPGLFRRLALESQDRPLAAVIWVGKKEDSENAHS